MRKTGKSTKFSEYYAILNPEINKRCQRRSAQRACCFGRHDRAAPASWSENFWLF